MAAPVSDKSQGFIILISVLIVSAVGIAVAISVLLLGLGSSKTSFALEQSNQAKALANACAEEGLQQIRDDTAFSGSGNLVLGQGSCSYTVTDTGGESRVVTCTGTVGTVVRRVQVTIDQISLQINIVSWQELADF